MFKPNTAHCTTCNETSPEVDSDGYTRCCNDTVCVTDSTGRCDRCNPLCESCGWEMTDGWQTDARGRRVHPDKTCPKGTEPKKPARKRQPVAPKMGDPIVVKEMRVVGVRGAHAECDHPATSSARAKCRRERAKNA